MLRSTIIGREIAFHYLPVTGIYRAAVGRSTETMWVSSVSGKECTVAVDDESASVSSGLQVGKTRVAKSPTVPVPNLWDVPEVWTSCRTDRIKFLKTARKKETIL